MEADPAAHIVLFPLPARQGLRVEQAETRVEQADQPDQPDQPRLLPEGPLPRRLSIWEAVVVEEGEAVVAEGQEVDMIQMVVVVMVEQELLVAPEELVVALG